MREVSGDGKHVRVVALMVVTLYCLTAMTNAEPLLWLRRPSSLAPGATAFAIIHYLYSEFLDISWTGVRRSRSHHFFCVHNGRHNSLLVTLGIKISVVNLISS